MKKFRFSLRPVAVLRAHRQALAREAFAAAVHAFVRAEEARDSLWARRAGLEKLMQDGRRGTFRAADEIAIWDAYRQICTDVTGAERVLAEARTRMEQRREEYLEAHRAVRIVEKLEQKARTVYRQEVERESQKELDEMGGFRVARRLAASTITSP